MSVSHITLEEQGGTGELTGLLKSLTVIINILLLNADGDYVMLTEECCGIFFYPCLY